MDAPVLPSAETPLDSLPDAVLFVDPDGIVLEATARIAELGGWSPEALVGSSVGVLFPGDQAGDIGSALRRWWDDGSSPLERRMLRLRLAGPTGEEHDVGVRIHRSTECYSMTIRRLDPVGGDLRAALLDAVSAPSVTASALAVAAAEIGRSFSWDIATVWTVDLATSTLRAVTVWEHEPDPDRRHRSATLRQPFLIGEGLPGRAWQAGEVTVVDQVGDDPRFGQGYGTHRHPQSGVLVPLRTGRRVVGVLELFSYADVDAGLWLASEGEAVGTGLGQLVERFLDRLQADAVEGRLSLALDAGELGVWTLDARSGRARWSSRMADLHGVLAIEGGVETLFAAVVVEDRPTVGAALERARTVDEPHTVEYRVHDSDRGTCWLSTRLTRVQTHGGPPLLSAVSSDITDRKRTELSAQRRRAAVEGLQWVSQAIIAGRQLADTAMAVAHAATGVLGADVGVVLYPEPGEIGSQLAWAVSGLSGDEPVTEPPRHLELDAVARTATGVENLADLRSAPVVREFVRELGLPIDVAALRSAMLVPVGGENGRPLGLMVFLHAERRYFTDDDARLAASIGSSTGVAIENAHRHEQQRLAATTFQRQLLPQDGDLPGIDVCVRYHPGRDGLDVGGDWYDIIKLDDDRIGFAVGDVCGHGITAAAHMGQFRYSFRALVQSSSTPEEALAVLNRIALEEVHTTATLAYIELDITSGRCRLWNCGHLPPVMSDGSSVQWIDGDDDARGPMLGFVRDLGVRPIEATLDPGTVLLLYTDGLVERRRESIEDGLRRLGAALERSVADLDDLCDELYRVLAQVGPEADDTVLVGVRRP